MAEEAEAQNPGGDVEEGKVGPLPTVNISAPVPKVDFSTIFGLLFAVGVIGGAIVMGQSNANFINVPSFMIVILGTIAATAISFTGAEFSRAGAVIGKSILRRVQDPQKTCDNLISLALISKKKGLLGLSAYEKEMAKFPFLDRAIQLVVDGYKPEDIEKVLDQEIESLKERHKRSAQITMRASEVAPSMGLIGTLVGLVQMLAELENPETIGPAMAVALLTTFYGAILGTVIMGPLSVKLEKNSADEVLIKTLIKTAAVSIARQDNPRRLEMLLNAELPPSEQIKYFD